MFRLPGKVGACARHFKPAAMLQPKGCNCSSLDSTQSRLSPSSNSRTAVGSAIALSATVSVAFGLGGITVVAGLLRFVPTVG